MAIKFPIIKNLGLLKAQLEAAFASIVADPQTWASVQAFPAAGVTVGGIKVLSGVGSPAGAVSAPVGSLYLRSDGGANASLYVKEAGSSTSGWVAK